MQCYRGAGQERRDREARMKLQSGFDTRRLLSMLAEALSRENELWKPRVYSEEVRIKSNEKNNINLVYVTNRLSLSLTNNLIFFYKKQVR